MQTSNVIEIYEPQERDKILSFWDRMKSSHIVDLYGVPNLSESVGLVLTGQARFLIGLKNGEEVACCIFQTIRDGRDGSLIAVIKQLFGPNLGFDFRDKLFEKFKQLGFRRIGGTTSHENHVAFGRAFGMKHIYSYYEREV